MLSLQLSKSFRNGQNHNFPNVSKMLLRIYTQRGFKVNHALLDGEFVPLRTDLLNMGIVANFATRNEHVPEIERQYRVIKERARACRSTLPFEVFPQLLLV